MGINIAISYTESEGALCNKLRAETVKVHVPSEKGFEDVAEYDRFVTYEDAKAAVDDWAAFVKRNRLNEEADAVYLTKIKKDEDMAIMEPLAKSVCTGWICMDKLDGARRKEALDRADDKVTEWDRLEFDEMNEMCASCPLSWDKGRGCIGIFGPENSMLPEIAGRHGCPIVASVPDAVAKEKRFGKGDAEKLLKEVEALKAALPDEGKLMVRRYSGTLDRLEAMAKAAVEQKCGFYFF